MNNANRRRAPNCRRVACRTTESDLTSSRLLANDIQRLAVEYRDWRLATQQVQMKLIYSEKRIRVLSVVFSRGRLLPPAWPVWRSRWVYDHDVSARRGCIFPRHRCEARM